MDLLILAAGMGSRFGGLKQIEPIDAKQNFIIDYSIYDAKKAGFDRVVFLIKKENYEIFASTVGKRVEKQIEVAYAFQTLDVIPEGYVLPKDRVKPLGTAQAILCAKDVIRDDFAIVNSDDFYGDDAFKVAAGFLRSLPKGSKGHYANIGYQAKNTLTKNGSVKRGILLFDEEHNLHELIESKLEWRGEEIYSTPLDVEEWRKTPLDTLVSMNMFAFTRDIFDRLEEGYVPFMEANKDNLATCEYLIPTVVSDLIEQNQVRCEVLSTSAVWHGVTYREDKPEIVASLAALVKEGLYPADRFGE